jgi:C-terminal processing protease CtpA/Prc
VNSIPFSDQGSFWTNLCAVHDWTNGVDRRLPFGASNATTASGNSASTTRGNRVASQDPTAPREVAALPDLNYQRVAIDLPEPFVPPNNYAIGSNDVTYFTMLPNTSVGVMVLGSFYPENYREWEQQVVDGIMNLVNQSADHLIIDVTNNPGGYVCAQELVSDAFHLPRGTAS